MKISDIYESTTAGSVATVATPMGGTQTRGKGVYPNQKGGNLLTGKKTNKKFANSIKESATVSEAELSEQDLIVIPGQGMKRKSGFVPHGASRIDHEVEMARSDLFQSVKNARAVHELIKDRSEEEGLEGWVQEKIIKANDYLNTVREYLEGKSVHEMTGGTLAGGIAAESVVSEKAVSKAQQKFFGMAHAMQKGEKIKGASKDLKDVAKSMTKGDVKDFAKTKHKGLPQHVSKKD